MKEEIVTGNNDGTKLQEIKREIIAGNRLEIIAGNK